MAKAVGQDQRVDLGIRTADGGEQIAVHRDLVVAKAADDGIGAPPAFQDVVAVAADDHVVARVGKDPVSVDACRRSVDHVMTAAGPQVLHVQEPQMPVHAAQGVDVARAGAVQHDMHAGRGFGGLRRGGLPGVQGVVPPFAVVKVVPDRRVAAAVAPTIAVVTVPAIGDVVAAAGLDHVVAVAAMDDVVAAAALDVVGARAAEDRVIAVAGIKAHADRVRRAVDIQDVGIRGVDIVVAVAQVHPLDSLEFDGVAVGIGRGPRLGRGIGDRHVGVAVRVQAQRVAAVVVVGIEGVILGPRHADDIGTVEDGHMPVATDIRVVLTTLGRPVPSQMVGALATVDGVISGTAVDGVIARAAVDRVALGGAHDRVVTRGSGKICGHG